MDIELSFYVPVGCLIASAVVVYLFMAVICARVAYWCEKKCSADAILTMMVFIFWPLALVGFLIFVFFVKPVVFLVTVGQENDQNPKG